MAKFGEMIRKCRIAAGKTLKQAADLLSVSVVYISEVELGKRPAFSRERIESLAKLYGTDPQPLLEEACREKGFLEVDMEFASPVQLRALSGLARGGLTEDQWEDICNVIQRKERGND